MNLFDIERNENIDKAKELIEEAVKMADTEKAVEILNDLRQFLHSLSPQKDPVACVKWVPAEKVRGNEYNPNNVAPPEMKLLHLSIKEDGYTQPIVCYECDDGTYEVVDGFHRNRVGKEYKDIKERTKGYLPIVIIDKPIEERMASTIRHNRARGKHGVRPMSELVADLVRRGWADDRIAKHLGMELDEVLRLKQITGLPDIFKDREYSKAWR